MRMVLGCAIVLGLVLVAPATAQKKAGKDKPVAIDPDKVVGKWDTPPVKGLKGVKGPGWEFTKDGKCYLGDTRGKGPRLKGTYTLDGDKLTITYDGGGGGPDEVHKYTVKKLTDTDLVLLEGKLTETRKRTK